MNVFASTPTGFKLVTDMPANASINMMTEHLGHTITNVFTFWHDYNESYNIQFVALEIFSRNIVYVATKNDVYNLDSNKVARFIKNLDDADIYDSYDVKDRLSKGIEQKTLSKDFLSKVLELNDIDNNGVFYSSKLDVYLYLSDGLLVDFQVADGLDIWAKRWKQIRPDLLAQYQETALYYWGNDHKAILNEINKQADAWANTPQAMHNEFIDLHRNQFGAVNFQMLLVCHYGKKVSLKDFLIINRGRYRRLPNTPDGDLVYESGGFLYNFDVDNTLLSVSYK
jgi:hypothetical protein